MAMMTRALIMSSRWERVRCSPPHHIVQAGDLVAQHFGGEGGLLGHGHVAGAAGGHHNGPLAGGGGHLPHNADAAHLVVGEGQILPHHLGGLLRHAGDEDGLFPGLPHRGGNVVDLPGCFPSAVDDLRGALAQARWLSTLAKPSSWKGSIFRARTASSTERWPWATCSKRARISCWSI